jgi:predicted transcriptional regulator
MSDNSIKYAIYHLVDAGKTVSEISKELKITTKKVKTIVDSRPSAPEKTVKPKDLFITETSAKRTKNVAIMTQAASMMADQLKDTLTSDTRSSKMSSSTIFRPLDNQ